MPPRRPYIAAQCLRHGRRASQQKRSARVQAFDHRKGSNMRSMLATFVIVVLAGQCLAQTDRPKVAAADSNVIAIVLEKPITGNEKDKLNGLILGALLERYARDNKIETTDEELDAFVRKTEEARKQQQATFEANREHLQNELKSPSLSDRDRKDKEAQLQTFESVLKTTRDMEARGKGMEERMRPLRRQMAQKSVKTWKINKSLYGQYGGRVIFQQGGPEPLDAYRDFLKEQENKGAFQILDKKYEDSFWRYYTNDAMHRFYSKDEGAKAMDTP